MALTFIGWIRTPAHTIWMGPSRSTKALALADAEAKLKQKPKWIELDYKPYGESTTSYERADDNLPLSEWPDI